MWMRRWTRPMSRTLPPLRGVSWVDMFRSPAGSLAPAVRGRRARSSARNGPSADVSKANSYEQAVGLSASRDANVPETSHDASDCAADAGGRPGVQIGCIRLSTAVVSGRLASPSIGQFAASLTAGGDWTLPLTFSDKEEVRGSSPGSPTRDFPAHSHFSYPVPPHGAAPRGRRESRRCSDWCSACVRACC